MEKGPGRVVVTGFEAFGGDEINPTAEAMRAFRRDEARAERMAFVVLPVTFDGAATVLHARLREEQASGCLMFGLAARRAHLEVEDSAFNTSDLGPSVLRVGGAEVHHPHRRDVDTVMRALHEAGAPCRVSSDPGRFVCNATYYETLATFGARIPVLFVHVPATTELGGVITQDILSTWMAAAIDAFACEIPSSSAKG